MNICAGVCIYFYNMLLITNRISNSMNRNNNLTNEQITLERSEGTGERFNSVTSVKELVKGKDFVLYPEQCTFLWKISWLSLIHI